LIDYFNYNPSIWYEVFISSLLTGEKDSSHQAIPNSGHVTGYPEMTFRPYKILTDIRNHCEPEIGMKKTRRSECVIGSSERNVHYYICFSVPRSEWKRPDVRNVILRVFFIQKDLKIVMKMTGTSEPNWPRDRNGCKHFSFLFFKSRMNENLVDHLTSLKEEQIWTQFQTLCLFHFDLQTFVTLISLTFITVALFFLLRSSGHFHSESRSKFWILSIKIDNHGSLRSPTQPALRTSCFYWFLSFRTPVHLVPNILSFFLCPVSVMNYVNRRS
jgi:hypothetical protein